MRSMSSKIIEDRLTHRSRVLRTRWHSEGEKLLKAGKLVEFADGLLRLMRQLDAIAAAIETLPLRSPGLTGAFDTAYAAPTSARRGGPSRRPAGTSS